MSTFMCYQKKETVDWDCTTDAEETRKSQKARKTATVRRIISIFLLKTYPNDGKMIILIGETIS